MHETVAQNNLDRQRAELSEKTSYINGVENERKRLANELQRKVTIEELMEETGMSRKMIEDAVRMSGFKIEDIDNNAKDSL